MEKYSKVDPESATDPAAEFVDMFYSYYDSRYEINVEALNGEEDSFIIDLYNHSRPLTPSTPKPNNDPLLLETENPNSSDCESTFDSEIANVMAQKKDAEINVDTVNTTSEDRGRPRYRKKTRKFQLAKDTSQSLHEMPQHYSPKETAHVHN
ncbi:hypothetical protein BJ912DRAFT_976607 [Pholiota molesta]|nr:hypothetical protein BJ912DRAFT_976607 [Pholiota molesta]